MTQNLKTIGFDADDTLWHNERFFKLTQERFAELLADFAPRDHLHERLLEAEKRNLGHYGFGVKGFVLSMIETAIEITEEKVPARVIADLMEAGREMLAQPIELLPGVGDTVEDLARSHDLVLITKGDLLDQERKLAQSGLGDWFTAVEIVSNKTPAIYARIFAARGGTATAMMVGNSLASDVVPALAAGAWAVHVPHDVTWELEHAPEPSDHPRFFRANQLADIAPLVHRLG